MRKRMIKILFMVVMIVGLIPIGAVTAFAEEPDAVTTDVYLYLDGIEGESKDPGHEKWIDLRSFKHSASQNQGSDSAKDSSKGFTFTHLVDIATPKLQEYCMKRTTIDTGKIEICRHNSEKKEIIYSVDLEGIKVTKAEMKLEELEEGILCPVETVEIQVNNSVWNGSAPLPEEPIAPGTPMGSTELERIRTLLDEYDQLAQDPAHKAKLDAVPGYGEWIAQLRIRLAELEQEECEKEKEPINEKVDSTDSHLSPATGIIGASVALPLAFTCIGLAMIGLSVVWFRSKKQ